ESVSPDYLAYQIWDTVQAFASSITGTLATQAVLKGVGVGDETSTVTAATVTWILKGGSCPQSKLDCDAKQWRLFADVLNDVAILMEILAPAFPAGFTFIVCLSGFFKCIVGVAGGATRAALTMHQARRDNMADVSAKDGSQETLVNLAGLLFSLLLIPLVAENLHLTYAFYGLFTVMHLYANYRAVRAVCMETLNRARLRLLFRHFLERAEVPGPAVANPQEPLLLGNDGVAYAGKTPRGPQFRRVTPYPEIHGQGSYSHGGGFLTFPTPSTEVDEKETLGFYSEADLKLLRAGGLVWP
uniref:Chromosome 16 open reading frame 58 n=1 Tax=Varanus komodoensis TaxID=61221 RepID=A0A8D2IXX8_VARKO